MTFNEVLEGMEIIGKYYDDKDDFHVSAEHDQIYLDNTDRPICEEDLQTLDQLGWFQTNISEGYDPDEMWSAFV